MSLPDPRALAKLATPNPKALIDLHMRMLASDLTGMQAIPADGNYEYTIGNVTLEVAEAVYKQCIGNRYRATLLSEGAGTDDDPRSYVLQLHLK